MNPVDSALADLNKAMRTLKEAIANIPVRREKFKRIHDDFARSTARMSVELCYSRSQLPDN